MDIYKYTYRQSKSQNNLNFIDAVAPLQTCPSPERMNS